MNFPLEINYLLLVILVNWRGALTQDDKVTKENRDTTSTFAASNRVENATSDSTKMMIAEIFGNGTIVNVTNQTVSNNQTPKMDGVGDMGKLDFDEVSWEISDVFHGDGNVTLDEDEGNLNTTMLDCINSTAGCHPCGNETIKCDYKLVMEKTEYPNEYSVLGTVDAVAVAAAICLVSAIIGYFSCVGYRRYMQRKYGNSRVVVNEDVYDTTDLRYFEI